MTIISKNEERGVTLAPETLDEVEGLRRCGGDRLRYGQALGHFAAQAEGCLAELEEVAMAPQPVQASKLLSWENMAAAVGARALQQHLRGLHAPLGAGDWLALAPLWRAAAAAAVAQQSPARATVQPDLPCFDPASRLMSGRPRLLVIDDQPLVIRHIHAALRDEYQVFMATDGAEGLRLFQQHLPDLILLDVVMPDLDGLAVAAQLRALPGGGNVPIIFVTGHTSTDDETACWEAGAVDFINKPVNPLTLRHRVRVHLTLKRHADMLRELAYLDGLTGVANRRSFDERLEEELRRAQRDRSALTLLLADVDFFKRYNDSLGHPAGDLCLREVAQALRKSLERPGDFVARFGGEEFAVLLPGTGLEGAKLVAEHLEQSVRGLALAHPASEVGPHVTVSIGGVCVVDGLSTSAELLGRADHTLYEMKHAGRGRASVELLIPCGPGQ